MSFSLHELKIKSFRKSGKTDVNVAKGFLCDFVPGKILYLAGIYYNEPEGDCFTILPDEAEGV